MKSMRKPLKLDIQFFAETPPAGDTPPGEKLSDKETPPDATPKKVELTEEEFAKKVESEADKKIAKVLERKQVEWEAKQQEAVQTALEERERLSKLSEKERKEEELSTREKKLLERQAEIERKELKADAVSDLSEKGLPASFAEFLVADNAEKTLANINKLKETFDAAVNEAVKDKLRQDTPRLGDSRKLSTEQSTDILAMARKNRIIK